MTESPQSKNDLPLESSIPDGAVSLESILRTEELHRRPWRPPDYGKESRGLVAMTSALADSPGTILQTLAEKVLEVLQADSAGLSLLTKDEKRFYWAAIAGAWQPHIGGGTPRDFGPCGDVLDRNIPMLFTHWERRYPYLRPATPLAEEGLLVPFYVKSKAVGTIWAIAHNDRRKFDAEDLRLLESLGRFASAAYQAVASIDDLKFQIAAREKAEAEVRELANGLEAKVRRLVDSNLIGIFIWGLDGRIIDANEAFLHIVGYGREDLVSGRMRWTDLTPAEWRDRDERAVTELKATGICQPFEKEYLRKDGSRVPVLVAGALFEEGGSEGVAFALDLSEQKQAEEALHRSENYLAEAQKLTHTGSWAIDGASHETVYWSEEMFRLFGFDPQQGLPSFDQWLLGIHPEDRDKVKQASDRTFLQKLDCDVEFRLVKPDGTVKHIHSIGHPVLNRNGELVQVVGTMVDITERKGAEETLRAQANLLNLTNDAIFVRDLNLIIKYWNRGAEDLYRWTAEEAKGKISPELLKTVFPSSVERVIEELLANGRWEGELLRTTKDGTQVVVASRWSLQRDDKGAPIAVLETNNDVTQRKHAEEERERLRQELAHLAHLNRVSTLGELTASLAHEINQPLAAIVTNAQVCLRWLMRDVPDLEEVREAAELIARDGKRASDVISRIRALSRKTGSEKAQLEINQAIQDVLNLMEHEAARKGVALRTELADHLPFVLGDRVQLQQVLLNLIINGMEAMSAVADGPRELLVYSRLHESNQVLVGVQDSGVGIEPENLKKIFHPFHTTKSQGMGMGLAISRSIVENHGGKLWASPNDGPGATFQFTL